MRSKRLQLQDVEAHRHNQSVSSSVKNYVDARKSGIQPQSVFKKDVDFARKMTDATGVPFRADE